MHASQGDPFYLRMLLQRNRGATSFKDLRTVDHRVYATFKESCEVPGLLRDDNQWHYGLRENADSSMPQQLRSMFVFILTNFPVADPSKLWTDNWKPLSKDILYLMRKRSANPDFNLSDVDLQNYALKGIIKTISTHTKKYTHNCHCQYNLYEICTCFRYIFFIV